MGHAVTHGARQVVCGLHRNFRTESSPPLVNMNERLRDGECTAALAEMMEQRWLGSANLAYQLPFDVWNGGVFAVRTNEARLAGNAWLLENIVAAHNVGIS